MGMCFYLDASSNMNIVLINYMQLTTECDSVCIQWQ